MHGLRGRAHAQRGQSDRRQPAAFCVQRDLDRRRVFARVGDHDKTLAGAQAVVVLVALGEARAVAEHVLRKPVAGIKQPSHRHQSAGPADDLACEHFRVPGAEKVQHAALGDGAPHEGAERAQGREVAGAHGIEQRERGGVVGIGERHGGKSRRAAVCQ